MIQRGSLAAGLTCEHIREYSLDREPRVDAHGSHAQILATKDKIYRVSDAGGLCIQVQPNSAKHWRFRYRYAGQAQMMSLGSWPVIPSPSRAANATMPRGCCSTASTLSATSMSKPKNASDSDGMFPTVAKAWLDFKQGGVASDTYRKMKLIVEGDLIPRAPALLGRHHRYEGLHQDPAKNRRARPPSGHQGPAIPCWIIDYAIKEGLREDGKVLALDGVIPAYEKNHIAAITRPDELGSLLVSIDAYGSVTTRHALLLVSWTALPPSIIASAQWDHIDPDAAEWHIPGPLMKMRHDHIVSLPKQAAAMLRLR